jgi:UDP-2-acetamido-3-amino-2,3-dideoxy-glucuronate N-acetyltransferase
MKKKIGLVGCGAWGKNWARNLAKEGVLAGICEADPDRLSELGKLYPKAVTFSSFSEFLANVDAVVVAAPSELHYKLVKEALLSEKDVLCEKPLALNTKDGKELVELAEEKKRILMVGHILRYHPAIIKLSEMITAGDLGKIYYLYSNRLNLGKIRREENALFSFAPHDISVILYLLGETPESISAYGGNYLHHKIADVTMTNLAFASGVQAHIFVSWLHPFKEQKLVVVGEKAMVVFDDVAKEDKLLLYPHRIEWKDRMPIACKEDAQSIKFGECEPLTTECRHFLECITKRETPWTDGREGLRVLEVLEKAQNALEKKKEISNSRQNVFIHPTAIADEPCSIGEGTKIWHFSHILKGSVIGKDCIIGQNVTIGPDVKISDGCKIQNNVSVYKGVELEDKVFVGPSAVFTNVYNPRAFIERKNEFLPILVKKGATIGANATIVCGVTIGRYALVGAGAVVKKDIPDHALVVGVPAKQIGWVCKCGTSLKFDKDRAKCSYCEERYELKGGELYQK